PARDPPGVEGPLLAGRGVRRDAGRVREVRAHVLSHPIAITPSRLPGHPGLLLPESLWCGARSPSRRVGVRPSGTPDSGRYPGGMGNGYRVAVVGATGQVGTLMLELLKERSFPAAEIVAFASERSVGRELEGGLVVRGLDEESIQ